MTQAALPIEVPEEDATFPHRFNGVGVGWNGRVFRLSMPFLPGYYYYSDSGKNPGKKVAALNMNAHLTKEVRITVMKKNRQNVKDAVIGVERPPGIPWAKVKLTWDVYIKGRSKEPDWAQKFALVKGFEDGLHKDIGILVDDSPDVVGSPPVIRWHTHSDLADLTVVTIEPEVEL